MSDARGAADSAGRDFSEGRSVREEQALALFFQGYNCAQSVAAAFSDVIGIPRETLLRVFPGFGAGMGDHKGTCGTVSAMILVAGAVMGGYSPEDLASKRALYAEVNALKAAFTRQFGSISCLELLKKAAVLPKPEASERTAAYYAKRPCAHFVAGAVRILEAWLKERQQQS